jgi:DNA-binding transcriptional LysR family regulator
MDDLDLRDLHAFAAVARTRNFRRAAVEQGISVSGLSQRLRALEERLGVRLLNRTTRSVAPTQAGDALLARLAPALRDVDDALDHVRSLGEVPSGRLRINAPAPVVELVLAPMVAQFLARHPQIDLEIIPDTSLIDIVAEGFDAGVRFGEHLAQDMIAVSLGPPQRYAVVAAPAVIAAYGRPKHPKDLLACPGILTRFRNGAVFEWEFEKAGRTVKVTPKGKLFSLNSMLQIQAALDGVGFYVTFEGYVREHVAAGRLVSVLEDWCERFPGPFLYYPSRRQLPPALSAFVAFVADWRKPQGRRGD